MEKLPANSRKNFVDSGIPDRYANISSEKLKTSIKDIEHFHQLDLAAFRDNNVDMLVDLVTEDCIMLPPAQGPVCGRKAIREFLTDKFNQWEEYTVADFEQQFDEVQMIGNLAYEWGTTRGVYYMKNEGPGIFENSRLFRILRCQPDGKWKIARMIWHEVP